MYIPGFLPDGKGGLIDDSLCRRKAVAPFTGFSTFKRHLMISCFRVLLVFLRLSCFLFVLRQATGGFSVELGAPVTTSIALHHFTAWANYEEVITAVP